MSKDISRILRDWEFSSESHLVRRIIGVDGSEKIQRRIDLGVLQMEVEGRPDGVTPYGYPSLYDYFKVLAKEYESNAEPEGSFQLDGKSCEELQMEALLFYQRRICFFELQDYIGAARDARRNLEVFDFVKRYAERRDDVLAMDQFRAFVIFHRAKAEILGCLERKEYDFALRYVERAEEEILEFFEEYERSDLADESEEMKQLRSWRDQIERIRPLSRREILERELKEAVEREEYERAAELRDALQRAAEDNA